MGRLKKITTFIIPERIPGFAANLYEKVARTAITSYYNKVAEEIVSQTCRSFSGGMALVITASNLPAASA